MEPKWNLNGTQVESRGNLNGTQMGPNGALNGAFKGFFKDNFERQPSLVNLRGNQVLMRLPMWPF